MLRTALIAVGIYCTSPSWSDELHVCSTVAFKAVAEAAGKAFPEKEKVKMAYHFAPAGPVLKRVRDGEACDVVLLSTPVLRQLASEGKIQGEVRPVAETGIGIAGQHTAPPIKLTTKEDFIALLRSSGPIGMTDPSNGGAVSLYMSDLLSKPEFPADLKGQIRWFPSGAFPKALEDGAVRYWITQVSEIVPAKSVQLMANAPPGIQSITVISGGIAKHAKEPVVADQFLSFIRTADEILNSFGMSPAR